MIIFAVMKNRFLKRTMITVLVLFALLLLAVAAVLVSYWSVELKSASRRYSNVLEIPYNRVGLVLGTNPVTKTGKQNYYFKYRIDACVELYKAKKISKFLLSGDNSTRQYDEPQYMKDALMARGVPESDIVLDYAGFRTLDSVVRCKEVFGQESITIISQGFHNARAVCLAAWWGIDAIAFDAKDIKHSRTYLFFGVVREALARTKMYMDMLIGKQPKFLGEKIEI